MASLLKKYAHKPWELICALLNYNTSADSKSGLCREWRRGTVRNGEYIKVFAKGLIEVGTYRNKENKHEEKLRGIWDMKNADEAFQFLKKVESSPLQEDDNG